MALRIKPSKLGCYHHQDISCCSSQIAGLLIYKMVYAVCCFTKSALLDVRSSHSTGVPSTAGSMNFSHEKASLDAAEGAMLGVCVGDAAGAPLEFPRSARITEEKARLPRPFPSPSHPSAM